MALPTDPTYPDFPPGYLDQSGPDVRALISQPGPPPDPVQGLISQLLTSTALGSGGGSLLGGLAPQRQNLAQKIGPLYQPPMPRSSNEQDVMSRSLLSGLVEGFNNRAGVGPGAKVSRGTSQPSPLELARFGETLRHNRFLEGNTNVDNARADQSQKDSEARTQAYLELAQRAADRSDQNAARMWKALADSESRNRFYENLALQGLGLRKNADARAQQQAALRQKAQAAYAKLSPAAKAASDDEVKQILGKIALARQNDTEYDPSDDWAAHDSHVLQWQQLAGTQADPFGPVVAPGKEFGPAPIPPDAGGARAGAGMGPRGAAVGKPYLDAAKAAGSKASAIQHLNANKTLNAQQRQEALRGIQQVYPGQ